MSTWPEKRHYERTTTEVHDVTEETPIPAGATVLVLDYDGCSDVYFVEYDGRVYMALPEEIT